jgi:hypothetical protein
MQSSGSERDRIETGVQFTESKRIRGRHGAEGTIARNEKRLLYAGADETR